MVFGGASLNIWIFHCPQKKKLNADKSDKREDHEILPCLPTRNPGNFYLGKPIEMRVVQHVLLRPAEKV